MKNLNVANRCRNSYCAIMDVLLKLSENYQKDDNFDEKVFLNFMKQVTIWDYFGISKEDYFALPESQKRVKISQYYSEMQTKGAGECIIFC